MQIFKSYGTVIRTPHPMRTGFYDHILAMLVHVIEIVIARLTQYGCSSKRFLVQRLIVKWRGMYMLVCAAHIFTKELRDTCVFRLNIDAPLTCIRAICFVSPFVMFWSCYEQTMVRGFCPYYHFATMNNDTTIERWLSFISARYNL